MEPERCTVNEAHLITGISTGVLSRLARDGEISGCVKVDRTWMFAVAELRFYMASAEAHVLPEAEGRALAKASPCRVWMGGLPIETGKPNRVYLIGAETGHVKIGIAFNPPARLRDLQVGNPMPLRLLCDFHGGAAHESYLHRYFAIERARGEWFHASPRILAFAESMKTAR